MTRADRMAMCHCGNARDARAAGCQDCYVAVCASCYPAKAAARAVRLYCQCGNAKTDRATSCWPCHREAVRVEVPWQRRNRARHNELARIRYRANPDRMKAKRLKYREGHRTEILARRRRHWIADPLISIGGDRSRLSALPPELQPIARALIEARRQLRREITR